MQGGSPELRALIDSGDDDVYREVLRRIYRAWVEGEASDDKFGRACEMLALRAGFHSRWYRHLSWIDDELDLANRGILDREASVKAIEAVIEKACQPNSGTVGWSSAQ
jgi:hypothetical protein